MAKKKPKQNKKRDDQLSLFSGQIEMFGGNSNGTTEYPPSPMDKARARAPQVGIQYEGRFSFEVERELLLILAEEDAERWVAEIEWAKEEKEDPDEFLKRMGF